MAEFDADEARRLEEEARKQGQLAREQDQLEKQKQADTHKAEALRWWRENGMEALRAGAEFEAQRGGCEYKIGNMANGGRSWVALEYFEEARRDVRAAGFRLRKGDNPFDYILGMFSHMTSVPWIVSWHPKACCCLPFFAVCMTVLIAIPVIVKITFF